VRRSIALLAAAALAAATAAGASAAVFGGTYRGKAPFTRNPVSVRVNLRTHNVRFSYDCRETKDFFVYNGRLRGRRFHIQVRPRALRHVVVVDIKGTFSGRWVRGSIRQDECQGAIERYSARLR
jgi:hypothetical protein